MMVVAMEHVRVGWCYYEWHPPERQNGNTQCQVLTAPIGDRGHLLVEPEADAAEHTDAAELGRACQAIELWTEAAVTNAKIRRQAAERIALALAESPDLRHDAVIGLRRVERTPAREILSADRRGPVAREGAMDLDPERAILPESFVNRRKR